MVLQLQVWAFWLLQEAQKGISFDPRSVWGNMGVLGQVRCLCSVHHVGVVDRRHDRSFDRLQRRPQAIAAVRSGSRRRAARRQARRSHQNCRPLQQEPSGQSSCGRPAGIQSASDEHRDSGRRYRSLAPRSRTRASHCSRRTEARRQQPGHHRIHRLRSSDCSERSSAS